MALLPVNSLHRYYSLVAQKINEIKSSCLLCFFVHLEQDFPTHKKSLTYRRCYTRANKATKPLMMFRLVSTSGMFFLLSLLIPRAIREFFSSWTFFSSLIAFVRRFLPHCNCNNHVSETLFLCAENT